MINRKRKGTRTEHRAIKMLEAIGYICTRAGGSLGMFDVIAIGPHDVRCLQIKSGTARLSVPERERLQLLPVPTSVSKELWRFPDRCKAPLIDRL
jgi:Holliday junction resolvase